MLGQTQTEAQAVSFLLPLEKGENIGPFAGFDAIVGVLDTFGNGREFNDFRDRKSLEKRLGLGL